MQQGGKRMIIFIEECQLINVDRRIKIEKSPFWNHHSNNWFNQESLVDGKTIGEKTAEV